MASIFTFDPDPPRLSSPWPSSINSSEDLPKLFHNGDTLHSSASLSDRGPSKLRPEPSYGPVEYKLHLLLRPRRQYSSYSTRSKLSEPQPLQQGTVLDLAVDGSFGPNPSPFFPSYRKRQSRLEELTTQLLWRLQQSSTFHSTSIRESIVPELSETKYEKIKSPHLYTKNRKLVAGLEESQGSLYEIGVSDDGSFVGLTEDEMQESLGNLCLMAASLGCDVSVTRTLVVGQCQWSETPEQLRLHESNLDRNPTQSSTLKSISSGQLHQALLYVAEAFIYPAPVTNGANAQVISSSEADNDQIGLPQQQQHTSLEANVTESKTTNQLRCTFIGPTTSGKSSLIGTLTTASLDNGRGKIRLNLLKHRHEIESGVTSSVAQEIVGYNGLKVVNYASGNVSSWVDIHSSVQDGRLVLCSDCPGYSKHRRTIGRGLIGWAPHWNLLCIAASNGEDLDHHGLDVDYATGSAQAYLDLCLKLEKPLAIIVTKLDLTSKNSLKATLSKILSSLKALGRTPYIIPPDQPRLSNDAELTSIPQSVDNFVRKIIEKMNGSGSMTSIVPIVMTSSVNGTGISSLHALLRLLPIPSDTSLMRHQISSQNFPACLFHIEDVFKMPLNDGPYANTSDTGVIVSGHLQSGELEINDIVTIGPFSIERSDPNWQTAKLESKAESGTYTPRMAVRSGEWNQAQIVSLRNLRLPVPYLEAGQVGTIGLRLSLQEGTEVQHEPSTVSSAVLVPKIRKGMILAILRAEKDKMIFHLHAVRRFTAFFGEAHSKSLVVGRLVIVYISSIRSSARILRVAPYESARLSRDRVEEVGEIPVPASDRKKADIEVPGLYQAEGSSITFELVRHREWIPLASQVMIMLGGRRDSQHGWEGKEKEVENLESFFGTVIEIQD
ncbi:GTP-binding protein [Blumeria hordei DH14]|uniref:GTP-binding protein n=1 Tax=Blumeria graminis f. sp. hordei (strain DH14) TaxID=546991 RepID=N1JEE4_BLUG1|nr:GTP-binding protein [Blumeria hordei DH14]